MKKGACTGSISQMETLLLLSPAADSSHPTCDSVDEKLENRTVRNRDSNLKITPFRALPSHGVEIADAGDRPHVPASWRRQSIKNSYRREFQKSCKHRSTPTFESPIPLSQTSSGIACRGKADCCRLPCCTWLAG